MAEAAQPRPFGQSIDDAAAKAVKKVADLAKSIAKDSPMENWHLGSSHTKAFLANGLDELRQALHPGVQQIQPGQAPGLYGMPTTGEATAERLGETIDVPLSLDQLRGVAAQAAERAGQEMGKTSLEREGRGM